MRRTVARAALSCLGGCAIAMLSVMSVPPSAAFAQDAERSSIEVARSHMEQGQAYYLQGRFGEAAAEFEAAYEAEPFSAFLYNAAVAYENAGQPSRALDFFQSYLERDPNASDRDAVRQRIARLRTALEERRAAAAAAAEAAAAAQAAAAAAAAAEPGTTPGEPTPGEPGTTPGEPTPSEPGATPEEPGTPTPAEPTPTEAQPTAGPPPDALPEDFKSLISVRTDPDGATVTILREGTAIASGPSPFSNTLDQGRYRVRIEHPDFNVAEQDISVEPGKVYVVIVNLSQGEFLGYVRVITSVPGAQVFIDDREVGPRGQTPFEGPLPVGAHRVWIERAGYAPIEREVEVGIGAEVELREELERVSFGRVRVIGNVRGARVSIDGELVGAIPWEGQVDAGPHRVRVESDGMKAFQRDIEVQRGQLTPIRVRLRPDVGRGGAWVAMTFAVLSAGGGVAMALLADDLHQTLQREQAAGRLASSDERIDHGTYLTIGADSAFGLAVLLGALGIYYMFEDSLPPSEGTVLEPRDWALAPMIDAQGRAFGGAIGGQF